jgi:hypothetical protein
VEAIVFARVASNSERRPAPDTVELGVLLATIEGPVGPFEVLLP